MAGNDIWTIKAALDWTVGYLGRKGDENPRLSAQWLLSHACGLSRIELYANFDRPLSMDERDALRGYVTRRGKGEPLQYIIGEVGFRHITVNVRPGVLIPRPETEVLVSEALSMLPAAPKRLASDCVEKCGSEQPGECECPREEVVGDARDDAEASLLLVADVCTGSGCIACSLAVEHPCVRVVATDIAPEAVELARDNADALDVSDRVSVVQCDLGEGIAFDLVGSFDLVVSNPPYVPTSVLSDIPREVADFEPVLALDGGPGGLDIFQRLLPWCREALKPGGAFAFELHETCLDEAARLAREAGFVDVRIVHDLAERPRVLAGRTPLA